MIGIIGLSVLASGLIMAHMFKSKHIQGLENSMVREIAIIATGMKWTTPGDNMSEQYDYYTKIAEDLHRNAGARITFIRADGVVVGDSDHDPRTMDNHLQRKEVQGALKEGTGRIIRLSDTMNTNMLYVAKTVNAARPFL